MQHTMELKAIAFAHAKHEGQKYGDKPYTYHLKMVADNIFARMKDDPLIDTYLAIAWLHDVMEDCGVTYDELVREFGVCIAECVQRLTKTANKSYEDYLMGCICSAFSREVKIADTMANLTESFQTGNQKGILKYPRQLDILVQGAYYERSF